LSQLTYIFLLYNAKKEQNLSRCGTTGIKSISEAGKKVKKQAAEVTGWSIFGQRKGEPITYAQQWYCDD